MDGNTAADRFSWARVTWTLSLALLFTVGAILLGCSFTWKPLAVTYSDPSGFAKFFQSALFDAAIAIVITWVVSEAVQRSYERRLQLMESRMLDSSTSGAAKAAFGSFYGPVTVDEVYKSIFFSPLVRERYFIEYTFRRHEVSSKLVRLDFILDFDIKNMSQVTAPLPVKVGIPNLMARFPADPSREKPELKSVSINGKGFTDRQLAKLNDNIDIDCPDIRIGIDSLILKAGERAPIRVECGLLKNIHDNEVMRTNYPSDNVTIDIINEYGNDLDININSIHRNEFNEKDYTNKAKNRWTWTIDGAFLPNNGWVLYWNDTAKNPSE